MSGKVTTTLRHVSEDDDFPENLPVDWWLDIVEREARDRDEGYEPDPEDVEWWNQQTRGEEG